MTTMPTEDAGLARPDDAGLSAAQAAQRLREDGPNALPGGRRRSLLTIAGETLREPMFLLLLAAGGLYLAFGDLREGLTLFGFVVATLALTLYQEGRTERAIEALRDLTSPRALVVRDGRPQRIAGRDVVRGDLLKLSEGDRVPADALLLSADGVRVDESLLTGEAVPVDKRVARLDERAAAETPDGAARRPPGGDDQPVVHAGTLIVQGQALARVTATGPRSEIGRIGAALGALAPERSPLQAQTARLVRHLAVLALLLSLALVLVHGWMRGDWLQALLAGIALAMAMLPEEYPVVMTVFPALGAHRLSQAGVLTRRISAIETLGATTVLCSDKTGTLTANRMTVTRLVAGGVALGDDLAIEPAAAGGDLPEAFHALVEVAILASVVDPHDPMEQAFHQLGARFLADTEHLHRDWRLVRTYALSPALRAMSHVWSASDDGPRTVAAKGAPEAVMDLCHLDAACRARIADRVDALAAQGLRVLAVARGTFEGQDWPASEHDFDFAFVGLLGLADPVRPEVPAAVAECRAAGLRVVMITGDYPATARAIARQAGLITPADGTGGDDVLSGDEIATLDDAALRERLATVRVCARIAPDQKLRIVQALKARGEVVAMTGDGVNDAPALKQANIGVAMGITGTSVAKEAAAIVLTDDNFASITAAVEEGRRVYDNLVKSLAFVLPTNLGLAMILIVAVAVFPFDGVEREAGGSVTLVRELLLPMEPTQILWINLVATVALALPLAFETRERNVMQRPPRSPDEPVLSRFVIVRTFVAATLMCAGATGLFVWEYFRDLPLVGTPGNGHLTQASVLAEAQTMAVTTVIVFQIFYLLNCRSLRHSLRSLGVFSNKTIFVGIASLLVLQATYVYAPFMNSIFGSAPLAPIDWLWATLVGAIILPVITIEKWDRNRRAARRLRAA